HAAGAGRGADLLGRARLGRRILPGAARLASGAGDGVARLILAALLALASATGAASPAPRPGPAIPALVAAFARHPVVAIAESHGIRQFGDFYVALVRDAAFQRTVNDVVIEFASRQSQRLLDRWVVAGDSLPADSLRSIWRNTIKVGAWEFPLYAR